MLLGTDLTEKALKTFVDITCKNKIVARLYSDKAELIKFRLYI